MKKFVCALVLVTSLVACAQALPGGRHAIDDSIEDVDDFYDGFSFAMPDFFAETMTRLRNNLMSYFWNLPDITNMKIPEGANTTSTVKIIDGHVVTINETTYSSGDANSNTAFRIRIIDVKPQNETVPAIGGGGNAEPTTVRAEAPESAESVEDFNNEIPKNADTLTA